MISKEEAIAMALLAKFSPACNEDKYMKHWRGTSANVEAIVTLAYNKGLEDAVKVCHPNLIGEHPPGSGKDDRFDLGRLHCVEQIRKLKEQ